MLLLWKEVSASKNPPSTLCLALQCNRPLRSSPVSKTCLIFWLRICLLLQSEWKCHHCIADPMSKMNYDSVKYLTWWKAVDAAKVHTGLTVNGTDIKSFRMLGHVWLLRNKYPNEKVLGPGNITCTWFGEVGSCCCLPLLPQLACNILATTYKYYFRAQ